MSYVQKTVILGATVLVLLAAYLLGGRVMYTEETRERVRPLLTSFSPDEVRRIEIDAHGTTGTRLVRRDEGWYLGGSLDDSLYPAENERIRELLRRLDELEAYTVVGRGEDEWDEFSGNDRVSVELSLERDDGGFSQVRLVYGGEVPGSDRRYAWRGEGTIYEAQDLRPLLAETQSHWADLTLVPEGIAFNDVIAAEIIRNEDAGGYRLELREGEDDQGRWEIRDLRADETATPEQGLSAGERANEDEVRRMLNSLLRLEGRKYAGRASSLLPEDGEPSEIPVSVLLETVSGSTVGINIIQSRTGGEYYVTGPGNAAMTVPEHVINRVIRTREDLVP